MRIVLSHNTPQIRAAIRRAPAVVMRHRDRALGRSALTIARDARNRAPKASSELAQSILPRRVQPGDWIVFSRHRAARYVEEGTRHGGWPPRPTILEWMRQHGITAEDGDQDSLAFLIQNHIFHHGTKRQPFMRPAFEANLDDVRRRDLDAVGTALREIGGRG